VEHVDIGGDSDAGDSAVDVVHYGGPEGDGVEDGVAGPALGVGVHFVSILLVLEGESDKLGKAQGWMSAWEDVTV
jgi:hypothetical protein